jgi:uncharacterized protein
VTPVTEGARPVESGARIAWLDALRGVALLGILWANVRQMFLPFDAGGFDVALGGSDRLAWLDWQFFHAVIDLKFLTIFSTLFGISFALQGERISARGSGFSGIYLRRVLILALFGIVHGLLLYPAEVLFAYAIGGLLMLAMRDWPAERLLRAGVALLCITLVWGFEISALGSASARITTVSAVLILATIFLLWRQSWRVALLAGVVVMIASVAWLTVHFTGHNPDAALANDYRESQEMLAAIAGQPGARVPEELLVRRSGSFLALVRLHAGLYGELLFYLAIFLLWRTLALFMIGAGLYRSGFVTGTGAATWSKVAVAGIGVGLPMSIAATWLQGREAHGLMDWRWPDFLHTLSALPLAAGIAGLVWLLCHRPAQRWLWRRVEAAGRTALTNYIGQSLVVAALAESWGLGLYGHLDGVQMTMAALAIYAVLTEASYRWLLRHRMGPLEWLWRCGTYWTWLPNRRPVAS